MPQPPDTAAFFTEAATQAPPAAWSVALVIAALALFVTGMAWLLSALARRLQAAAQQAGPTAFARLTELPCGVPDGTIRALISCFIVIFGFLLIGLQKPLGLASAEALTGFIGAVISFYFATRQSEQSRAATPTADPTPASTALATARSVLDAAATAAQLAPDNSLAQRAAATASAARTTIDAAAEALRTPTPTTIATAASAAEATITAALGQTNPATSLIADTIAALRASPALLGLGGSIGGPAGLVAAIGLGALQAIGQGAEHFERWKARILDRPYTANLFPPGPVDGAVALSALEASPIFARAWLTPNLAPAERFATATRLATLAQGETEPARIALDTPGRFASADEFAAGLQEFRARLLDTSLDAVDARPIDLAPAGLAAPPIPQAALRDTLATLRTDPAARDLDRLVLLLTGMAASPDLTRAQAADLLRRQLAAAA